MTLEDQEYIDLTACYIVGDQTTFTGQAGDTITVIRDGTTYANIDIAASASIADVVDAINTAVGSTVAEETTDGYLRINGTTGVSIADGSTTAQTVIAELFSIADARSVTPITDLDHLIKLVDRANDREIRIVSWDTLVSIQPDPTTDYSNNPDFAARAVDRIYFSPTPSVSIVITIDYYKLIAKVTSASTMPFDDRYDPLIVAMAVQDFREFMDSADRSSILTAKENVGNLIEELIASAPSEALQQCESRRATRPYFNPQPVK